MRDVRIMAGISSVGGKEMDKIIENGGTILNPKGKNLRSVWNIPNKGYKGAHYAAFPIGLVEPMIRLGSKPGDTVMDPFAGTSTVGIVCKKLNRNFVGIELDWTSILQSKSRIKNTVRTLV